MTVKSDAALVADATVIRNESDESQNTAARVGQFLIDLVDSKATPTARNTYYINPLTTSLAQNGLYNSPFISFAQAFTAALLANPAGGIFIVPSYATITEAVSFPDGGDWEVGCEAVSEGGATIVGAVTCNNTSATRISFKNINLTGGITGAAQGAGTLLLHSTKVSGAVSLTVSGGGSWAATSVGGNQGNTSVAGTVEADDANFTGTLTAYSVAAINSKLPTSLTVNGGTRNVTLQDCVSQGETTITGSGGTANVKVDGYTLSSLMNAGLNLATATLKKLESNLSDVRILANNLGATAIHGGSTSLKTPAGLYDVVATLGLIAAGTSGNPVSVNIIYKDFAGVQQTVVVATGLNIAGATGVEVSGSARFYHDGSQALQYSVTGVTTPGGLSMQVAIGAQRRN